MNIRNENPELLSVGWIAGPVLPGEPSTTFVVKATLRIVPGDVAAVRDEPPEIPCGEVYEDDDAAQPLRYPGDFALFKPRADVLVTGSVYAPGGKATLTQATIQVETLVKSILAIGDREWQGGGLLRGKKPSDPQPFDVLPLTYRRAHGGPAFAPNPTGRGHKTDALPNFELPGRLITSQSDKTEPAGFGPIAAQWPQRASLIGTYHDKWAAERWPCPPRDFDFAHYNAAPRDQQVEGYLKGDETLRFQNLHPEHEDLITRLPGLRARCFLNRSIDGADTFDEVDLELDTLWVDVDAEMIVLTWRGRAAVRSSQMTDVVDVFVCAEPLAGQRDSDESYRRRMERLSAEEPEEAEEEEEGDSIEEQMGALEAEFEADRAEFAAIEAESVAAEQAARQRVVDAGSGDAPPPAEFAADMRARIANETDAVAIERMQMQLAEFEQADATVAELEQNFERLEAELEAGTAKPLTREDVVARLAAGEGLVEAELVELDLAAMDFSGVDLSGADLSGAVLREAVFRGATLVGTTLAGADLSAADFGEANLTDADLTGCVVVETKLGGATLAEADLSGLDLQGADLGAVQGERANFGDAKLAGARFDGAVLPRVDFIGADLQGASFVGADLTNADLHQANARGAVFIDATLDEARASLGADFGECDFTRVSARDSVWEVCVLDGADLHGATFPLAQFTGSSMAGVKANRADLREAVFDDAILSKASLIYANLLRASFVNCDLTDADLSGANVFGAGFVDAKVDGVILESANVQRTLLARGR